MAVMQRIKDVVFSGRKTYVTQVCRSQSVKRWKGACIPCPFAARQKREVGKVLNEFPATPASLDQKTVMIVLQTLGCVGNQANRAKIRELSRTRFPHF